MGFGVMRIELEVAAGHGPVKTSLRAAFNVARNPLPMSIALGIVVSAIGLPIPTPAGKWLDLLGAAAGSNLAKNDRGTGTAIGAVVGAATGSYVGCKMQRTDQAQNAYGYGQQYQPAHQQPSTYSHAGYRLSGDISPARYVRDGGAFAASSNLNLRGAPSTSARKVGSLQAGERFQALARVRGTDWILVGQNGVGVGYVSGRYAQPVGYQYAAYGY